MYARLSSVVCLLTLLSIVGCGGSSPPPASKGPDINSAEYQKKMMGSMHNATSAAAPAGDAKPAEGDAKPAEEKPVEEKPAEEKKADEKPAEDKKE